MHLEVRGIGEPNRRYSDVVATELEWPPTGANAVALCGGILRSVLGHLDEVPLTPERAVWSWTFLLSDESGSRVEESELFRAAAEHPELHDLIHEVIRATASGAHGVRPWADDEMPTGSAGAVALAVNDATRIRDYIDFLRECDLDHEVDQYVDIADVVTRHGWNADTCALAAARLASCSGQWGPDQVAEWMSDAGLDTFLSTPQGTSAFADAARAEVAHPASHGRVDIDEFEPYVDATTLGELRVLRARLDASYLAEGER